MPFYNQPKTVAEYFAGIGLVRMGLEPHGWEVLYANDISAKKYEMYKSFYPTSVNHYTVKDIFQIEVQEVPKTTLATCSFPCIDLSLAGNMNGFNGKHSSAFWGFIRILSAQKDNSPPIILVENVPGWLSSNKGSDFRTTVMALNSLGYFCDVFTLDALHFTPQSRKRVFLIGIKPPFIPANHDLILSRPISLLSNTLRKNIEVNLDLDWFYIDLPSPPPLLSKGLSEVIETIKDADPKWWSDNEVKKHFLMMSEAHRIRVQQLIDNCHVSYRTFYRRMRGNLQRVEVRSDEIAGCLRTASGGSGKQFIIKAGKGVLKMRAMTSREYARLQGVLDNYPLLKNETQSLTGLGDAVCVPAIEWLAQNALNPLVEKCYVTTQSNILLHS